MRDDGRENRCGAESAERYRRRYDFTGSLWSQFMGMFEDEPPCGSTRLMTEITMIT